MKPSIAAGLANLTVAAVLSAIGCLLAIVIYFVVPMLLALCICSRIPLVPRRREDATRTTHGGGVPLPGD